MSKYQNIHMKSKIKTIKGSNLEQDKWINDGSVKLGKLAKKIK